MNGYQLSFDGDFVFVETDIDCGVVAIFLETDLSKKCTNVCKEKLHTAQNLSTSCDESFTHEFTALHVLSITT